MTCCSNNTSPANKVLLWLLKTFDGGRDLTNTKIKTEIPQEKGVSKRSADSSGGLGFFLLILVRLVNFSL